MLGPFSVSQGNYGPPFFSNLDLFSKHLNETRL